MKTHLIKKIVDAIWDDICGRCGGDDFLESLDDEIQMEIRAKWTSLVADILKEE